MCLNACLPCGIACCTDYLYGFGVLLPEPLTIFHGKVTQIFDALPETGAVTEIFLRILVLLVAPIVYPLSFGLALVGWSWTWLMSCFVPGTNPRFSGITLRSRIDAIRGQPGWQDAAARMARKSRYDDPVAEVDRLRGAGILNAEVEPRLDEAIGGGDNSIQVKAMMAQAMELREIYKDTHDLLIHAQKTTWVAFVHFVKELFKINHPEVDVHNFKFLRTPSDTEMTVDEWLKQLWIVFDDRDVTRKDVISADAFFYKTREYEASLWFLKQNTSCFKRDEAIRNAAKEAIQYFYPNIPEKTANYFSRKVLKTFSEASPCGNLFAIFLPKETSFRSQYRAHPYGHVCTCHPKQESAEIIEKLNSGQADQTTNCSGLRAITLAGIVPIPQFRILKHAIKPERGQKIFLQTPVAKAIRKAHKATLRELAGTIHRVSRDWQTRVA